MYQHKTWIVNNNYYNASLEQYWTNYKIIQVKLFTSKYLNLNLLELRKLVSSDLLTINKNTK